ncbi:putative MFS transporter superfamily [Helianthus annuus]|uniref:Major facilitator superfamily domain, MFS transporter superfamily n=1 Tax=Helianthus annuus TaxID=4232 RepID=A0A251TZR7_HELAN|nr:protein NUCLEAR FUSION DEFECTIVE 4 [Helianthus annuus]KAF5792976.1 putative major facilitator superfamily domain, MFS transporter superfamily [Helianthus annuus]KAJ0527856.1 putative MFS transporter superfamily [Helianthus annuus]KAJ0536672.1 putative MFS transporter superfamily [Helianthus annuus]KAJ0544290.1 putative MFS transporter superfamily [Helianthus annuus]KAJ0713173.1 putative MFS transporter superfamily [Helianthus annuus]
MIGIPEKAKTFVNNRWLVFVASMWVQSCSGIGYMYGSISPVIKSTMGYNQRQIAVLGVAKDIGDAIGFVAGSLSEVVPIWVVLFIGVAQNFFGYGLVWLTVNHTLPPLPLWVLCVCIFVGTNGETYFNTGALVSGVQNFPKSRGPVVGILKGFAGLSGAILTQVYLMFNFPDEASIIFVVAVGPTIVITSVMFLIRPVGGHKQARQSDDTSFLALYGVCLILAAYLLAVLILQDLVDLNQTVLTALALGLVTLVLLPVVIPVTLVFFSPRSEEEEHLLNAEKQEVIDHGKTEVILSEVEDETPSEIDSLPAEEREKRISHLQARLVQAAADGAVKVKKKKGPRRGEDFTLTQALVKADFLLMFFSLVLASGSGLTVIDNLGQMCQSLGYENPHIFVSMISIWNFLGRVAGGYFSELVVRKYAYPRPVAMAAVQVVMSCSLLYYAVSAPGAIYIVSVVMGSCYGAHWAIVPSAASELFGLKSFGALYNFLTLASPAGSLIFSGVIASGIYDYEAKIQSATNLNTLTDGEALTCYGTICYSITCGILSVLCLMACVLSMIVVYRTKRVYAKLYGSS